MFTGGSMPQPRLHILLVRLVKLFFQQVHSTLNISCKQRLCLHAFAGHASLLTDCVFCVVSQVCKGWVSFSRYPQPGSV